jgi:hypothetical protein
LAEEFIKRKEYVAKYERKHNDDCRVRDRARTSRPDHMLELVLGIDEKLFHTFGINLPIKKRPAGITWA